MVAKSVSCSFRYKILAQIGISWCQPEATATDVRTFLVEASKLGLEPYAVFFQSPGDPPVLLNRNRTCSLVSSMDTVLDKGLLRLHRLFRVICAGATPCPEIGAVCTQWRSRFHISVTKAIFDSARAYIFNVATRNCDCSREFHISSDPRFGRPRRRADSTSPPTVVVAQLAPCAGCLNLKYFSFTGSDPL